MVTEIGTRLRRIERAVAILVAILSTACGANASVGSSAGRTADAVRTTMFISVGQSDWAFNVAQAKGYFSASDLDVVIRTFANGADAATAFLAQGADVLQSGDLPTVTFLPHAKVKVIADTDHHDGVLLVAPAKVTSPSQLDGKTIGGVVAGSPGYWMSKYVSDNHLNAKIINLPTNAQVAALLSNSVDAVVSTDSTLGPLLARSSAFHVLAKYPSDNFTMVSDAFASKHPAAAAGVLTALDKAWTYIQTNLSDAAAIEASADGVTPSVAKGWLENGYGLSLKPQFTNQDYDQLVRMSSFAESNKQISGPLDICSYVDVTALKKVPNTTTMPHCPPA